MKNLLTLIVFFAVCHCLKAQTIDETAAVRYFELADSLKQGYTIKSDTWKNFLELNGNRLYIKNQNFSDAYLEKYRKEMEIVYMPQNDSTLQRKLKDPRRYYLTYVIYQYKAHESELLDYLDKLSSSKDAYIKSMYENAYLMLPKKLQGKSPETKLHFIAMENDAVAQSGNIVFTLWAAYNFDKAKYGALAGHELHHVLRKTKQYEVAEKDKGLLMLLNRILNEGGPDLIDKRFTMSTGFPENMRFGEYFLMTGEKALPMIDAAITEMATGEKEYTAKDMGKLIGSSGHIPGFYMSEVIERNGLTRKLIKNIQDPFQFVYLYNKAAKKDKANPYVFSEKAIAYLKQVESGAKEKN
ncbi:hypothetical protein CLV24_11929 [Pontibacter ummariensis]|uniref:Uncharacterized protein n=1 Tax=Pontibacter ummariensis TaxID=1610492 RepID=A0A239IWF3_9BACT|nr:DUF5700 domain-containing putative Zn-dependent protease [Pontibacter ummariensis]PRY08979.1 hypothetical protein CLV24_11929 [Pontibacter ummariensis]SNS97548.1 hypothetical protein SAMN06296052_11929 [Pontibacter ummariensis]